MPRIIAGIDEAGRGPVIGPLVIACCTIREEDESKLTVMGVKDSKLLTPVQREKLYKKIIKAVSDYKIKIIMPEEIDKALNDGIINLNSLEANYSVELINEMNPDMITLDCPSTNLKAYAEYVRERVKTKTEILAEHKADLNHPIVSAASILAKVTRDHAIRDLKEKVGENFGSGYPSDPLTVDFLERNYEKHESIFRKAWSSYQVVLRKKQQTHLDAWFK